MWSCRVFNPPTGTGNHPIHSSRAIIAEPNNILTQMAAGSIPKKAQHQLFLSNARPFISSPPEKNQAPMGFPYRTYSPTLSILND